MEKLKNKMVELLRWSEKYTKTDMVYLAQGGFWLILGQIAQTLFGIITIVAFANLLSKESFGTYQFIISIAAIISAFTLTGMGTAVSRAAARGSSGALLYGFHKQIRWSLVMVLASGMLAIYYFTKENTTLSLAFIFVGTTQPLISGFSLYKPYLLGRGMFRESAISDIFQRTIPFLSIITALLISDDPLVIVSVYFVSQAVSHWLVYLHTVKKYAPRESGDLSMVSYSKHLSLMTVFEQFSVNADKAIMWTLLGAAPVAIYTLAQTPIIYMYGIFGLVRQLVFPKLATKSLPDLKKILPQKIKIYFLAAILTVVAYIVAAPYIFKIFFPAYTDSVIFSQVLAISILAVPRTLISESFYAHERKKELYIVNLTTPITRLVFLAILLPLYGIWGAVAAILLTEWYVSFIQWKLFYRINLDRRQ